MRILTALADTVLPRRERLPSGEAVAAGALAFLAGLPLLHRAALRAGLLALEASPPLVLRRFRRFSRLPPAEREACLLRCLEASPPLPLLGAALRASATAWKALLLMLLYDDPRARAAIGYHIDEHVERVNAPRASPARFSARPSANGAQTEPHHAAPATTGLIEATALAGGPELSCDVLVVGSGAGGALTAARLAEAGFEVVVLEEGPHPAAAGLTREVAPTLSRLYRDGGATLIHGRPPILFQEGRCVGGGTVVNGGMTWRTPEPVMQLWRERHGLDFMTPEGMEGSFQWVEESSQVAPQPADSLSEGERVFAHAARSLGMTPRVNPRAQRDCRGSGVCILGCPEGRKQAAHLTYIPRAVAAGARIVTGARALRVLTERGRAVGVLARAGSDRSAGTFSVRAGAVVLACGALQTPTLLQRSGLAGNPAIGRGFRCHPSLKVIGLHDLPGDAWRGAHQGQQIHDFMDDGIVLAYVGIPPGAVAASLRSVGEENAALMERFGSMVVTGALIDDSTTGSVRAAPRGGVIARYRIDAQQEGRILRAVELLSRIHFEAGAERVLLPFGGLPELRSPDELRRLREGAFDASDLELLSVHAMGTCAMGSDPSRHATRPTGELWGVPGLWISDASLLPDRLGINPQLTIQALAVRVSDALTLSLRS